MGREYADLVYRLRGAHESSGQRVLGSNIFKEAADEIERLNEKIEEAKAFVSMVPLHTEDEHALHFVKQTQAWLDK